MSIAVAAVVVLAFLALDLVLRRSTRVGTPAPDPAGPPGAETPAVVDLLVNGWVLTAGAPAATLLDLAGREYVEVSGETVRPLRNGAGLRAYERMVFERVVAVQRPEAGAAPLGALAFRDEEAAKTWTRGFREAVIAEARTAGLSRARYGRRERAILRTAAAVTAIALGLTVLAWSVAAAVVTVLLGYAVLLLIGERKLGERDTPAGLMAASRWLGAGPRVSLAHAVALGLTPAPRVRFGTADRTLVWSSYGGRWRQVKVNYLSDSFPYGHTALRLLGTATLLIAGGGLLGWLLSRVTPVSEAWRWGLLAVTAVAVVTALAGVRLAVRTVIDLLTVTTVTGQILWLQGWRHDNAPDDANPARPWLHHLAIDDGRSSRTTAWGLPSSMATGLSDGQTITVRARPWSRRVLSVDRVRDRAVTPISVESVHDHR
ncbi:hypothetical protein ACQPZJ_30320 [Actinoplanes sp. CA-054009]